jgi:eukaryotic-like serine/threonine-protein kinase
MTTGLRSCLRCQSKLPAGSAQDLCPDCLLRAEHDGDAPSRYRSGEIGATVNLAGPPGVLETIVADGGPAPRVLLRDTDPDAEPPLHRPGSAEMPAPKDRSARLRILGEIARGGMGAVLKGRDEDLGRDLAVKVLLDAHRDNADLVRRFVEEAQIGGQLQHPGIVPIYELGAFTDRRPYFAMKLVKGQTLTELLAARKHPAEALPRFLGIFEQVCQTVAYAHARGVVHRDLKPSNIMVGSFGEVQVMDWGLAKVLARGGVVEDAAAGKLPDREAAIATARSGGNPDVDLSRAGSVMGTPSYMAPEQGRGEIDRIDERADVFALGSILCEILTGRPAFVGGTGVEIQGKAARGETAEALDRLDGCGVDAELVALARDCLAVEREDRPRDARAVSDRMTAHLAGVQERLRTSERERAVAEARAVEERRKRRWQLGLAASVAAFLLLGGAGLAAFAVIVDRKNGELRAANAALAQQRLRAEDREGQAIDAVKRFRDAVAENPELKSNAGLGALRKSLLKEPLAFFRSLRQRLQADADTRPDSLARLASASFELGDLSDQIGDKPDALSAHREALAIRQRLADAHPEVHRHRSDLAASQERLGVLLLAIGQPAEALASNKAALASWTALAEARPDFAEYRAGLAMSRQLLGTLLQDTGHAPEARAEYESALASWNALVDAHQDIAEYRSGLARSHVAFGHLLQITGRLDEAMASDKAALSAWETLAKAHPDVFEYRVELAKCHTTLGTLSISSQRYDEARAEHEASLPLWQALADAHPTVTEYRVELAKAHFTLGVAFQFTRRPAEARAEHEAARKVYLALAEAHPGVPDYANYLGGTLTNLALRDIVGRRYAEARDRLREAIAWQRKALAANPDNPQYRFFLRTTYANLLQAAQGLEDAALEAEARAGKAEMSVGDPLQAAVDARLAAVLDGAAPKDNAERLALARRAYDTARYAAAAKLRGEALAADPGLSESRLDEHAYNAACCAALAAAGRDRSGPRPDVAARARLRNQALGWLNAELVTWSKVLDSTDPQAPTIVAMVLRRWQRDTDLAGIRDPDALAALPGSERGAWQALWVEVDRLRAATGKAP